MYNKKAVADSLTRPFIYISALWVTEAYYSSAACS